MVLSSRTYLSLVLGGIGLICVACLVGRWRVLAESSASPQLGLQRGQLVLSEIGQREDARPDDNAPAIRALADPGASPGKPVERARQPAGQEPVAERDQLEINAASAAELEQLPGIGPVLAERIVATRDRLGGFASIEQLSEVDGIGEATLERLRPLLRIEPAD